MRRVSLLILFASLALFVPAKAFAGEMWLTIDQVRIHALKSPVSSIIVGNPAIADVTVQDNSNILLYGKTPGLTNIYFFDAAGKRVEEINIRVRSATGNMLVLHRGVERATYTCSDKCELTAAVGDSETIFGQISDQATSKVNSALSAASSFAGADPSN